MVLWTIRMKIIYKPINNDKVSQKRTLGTEHLLWRASTFVQVGGGGVTQLVQNQRAVHVLWSWIHICAIVGGEG